MDGPRDVILSEVSQIEKEKMSYDVTYIWNLKKWYKWAYLQKRSWVTEVENKLVVTKGVKAGVER